jgi:hypothetical protein
MFSDKYEKWQKKRGRLSLPSKGIRLPDLEVCKQMMEFFANSGEFDKGICIRVCIYEYAAVCVCRHTLSIGCKSREDLPSR